MFWAALPDFFFLGDHDCFREFVVAKVTDTAAASAARRARRRTRRAGARARTREGRGAKTKRATFFAKLVRQPSW